MQNVGQLIWNWHVDVDCERGKSRCAPKKRLKPQVDEISSNLRKTKLGVQNF
jgi:hypothetical protein